MAKISARHIKFINLVSTGVSQKQAYILTSPNKNLTNGTAIVEGSILAKKYALEIQEAKQKDADLVTLANKTDTVKNALELIVEQAKVDQKAFRILSEDDLVDDVYFKNGLPVEYKRKPTQPEIQKAFDLYCKRFGSYMPSKVAQTDTKGNDVEQTLIVWGGKNIAV